MHFTKPSSLYRTGSQLTVADPSTNVINLLLSRIKKLRHYLSQYCGPISMQIRIQGSKRMRIPADPACQTYNHKKLNFTVYMKNILQIGTSNRPKNIHIPTKVQMPSWKAGHQAYLVNFGQLHDSGSGLHSQYDQDPRHPDQCGSGPTTLIWAILYVCSPERTLCLMCMYFSGQCEADVLGLQLFLQESPGQN